jgi:hypothetical protein
VPAASIIVSSIVLPPLTAMFQQLLRVFSLLALAALAACMSPPAGLNVSQERFTTDNKYSIAIHALGEPVTINKMHAWEIRLRSPSGEAVPGATIRVGGGMPQHGHGFPTQPRVTKELGDGRYLVEGIKFSMPGWWEIKLNINGAYGEDVITFNTVIPLRAAIMAVHNAAPGPVRP